MSADRQKVLSAANRVEELLPALRDVVNLLREGHDQPYALVYEARRELSRVVATLGGGQPVSSGYVWPRSER